MKTWRVGEEGVKTWRVGEERVKTWRVGEESEDLEGGEEGVKTWRVGEERGTDSGNWRLLIDNVVRSEDGKEEQKR